MNLFYIGMTRWNLIVVISRAAQTVENRFGEPVRFGGFSLLAIGGLELTARLKVMSFMHSPRFFWIFAIAFYVNLILFPWIGP